MIEERILAVGDVKEWAPDQTHKLVKKGLDSNSRPMYILYLLLECLCFRRRYSRNLGNDGETGLPPGT
jgi:hypothetical protein